MYLSINSKPEDSQGVHAGCDMATDLDYVELVRKTTQEVQNFITEIERLYKFDGPSGRTRNRRETNRLPITMPVKMFPLTDSLEPRNYECRGVTRDISTVGVGLVTADPISGSFLKLVFEPIQGRPFSAIAKIQHCELNGYYFHVGCSYLNWDFFA